MPAVPGRRPRTWSSAGNRTGRPSIGCSTFSPSPSGTVAAASDGRPPRQRCAARSSAHPGSPGRRVGL
eukprot:9359623-Heterocapsa_arctica.AAC.1